MFNKIMVCLDGSELAEQIMPYATEQALHFSSKVVLLRVVSLSAAMITPVPGVEPIPFPSVSMEQLQEKYTKAENYLEGIANPLREKGLDVECAVLSERPAGEAIISYADENEIDLILMATHGRGGLSRVVLGSVADHVLRESGLPILVIKPRHLEV